jgi:hypothetical protein
MWALAIYGWAPCDVDVVVIVVVDVVLVIVDVPALVRGAKKCSIFFLDEAAIGPMFSTLKGTVEGDVFAP